jgi:poly(hydroxyalkanoate) depolymerase family esterase
MTDTFTNRAGTRDHQLYVPSHDGSERPALPLIVMLHGCSQNPDDFAAGTRMNDLAEKHRFLVLYPAQPVNANATRCWNWFRPGDQQRDVGEPALIAGMTLDVATRYGVDARRIFVAGLSAGGAMAVVLGATYPELYAGVGVHSGLPRGVAHDMPSAFAAMRNASGSRGRSGSGAPVNGTRHGARLPPTIVFHGDRDTTVHAENGADIAAAAAGGHDEARLRADVDEGVAAGGRAYRRTVYRNLDDQAVVEHWLLKGAGHAWSGGSARGSFTDPSGPDASAEMIRFFLSQPRAGTA